MSLSLGFLSISRILIGTSSLLSPTFTANVIASYPYDSSTSNTSSMPYRLFGSRELVLGSCLWLANSNSSSSSTAGALLRPLLLIGAIIDGIDIVATGACALQEGNLGPWALTVTAGGAALAIAIQIFAWSGLSQAKEGGRKVQ